MKNRILTLLLFLCIGTMAQMNFPPADIPDKATELPELMADSQVLAQSFTELEYLNPERKQEFYTTPTKAIGELTTHYTIIAASLENIEWESPIRLMDKHPDPGWCSLIEDYI